MNPQEVEVKTHWRRSRAAAIAGIVSVLAIAGCGGGSHGGSSTSTTTDFNAFVRQQLDETSDTTQPVPINDKTFRFSDDPNAFNDLFTFQEQ
jgi:hypothetical protein